jgi:CubicO group peptidase (beta-lactamase class C family)
MSHCSAHGSESSDHTFTNFTTDHFVPRGVIAVSHYGATILSPGYALLDKDDPHSPATPNNTVRISVTKPISAMGIMKLCDPGKVSHADKVCEHLRDDHLLIPGRTFTSGIDQTSLRHLLQYTSGSNDTIYDPLLILPRQRIFSSRQASQNHPLHVII